MCLSPEERAELYNILSTMVPHQFNHLIFTLKPPQGAIPPSIASQGDRVFALLSWAEAPSGCGLLHLQTHLLTVLKSVTILQQEPHFSPSKSLIHVTPENEEISVWDISTKRWHKLPPSLLGDPRKWSKQKSLRPQYARDWKRIHTLAERLYPRYTKLCHCMKLCSKMTELHNQNESDRYRDIAASYFEAFSSEVVVFGDSLRELSIRQISPITVLRKLPICSSAINQSLGDPPSSSIFQNGIFLTERISKMLLDALHIADQILELYFKELEVG